MVFLKTNSELKKQRYSCELRSPILFSPTSTCNKDSHTTIPSITHFITSFIYFPLWNWCVASVVSTNIGSYLHKNQFRWLSRKSYETQKSCDITINIYAVSTEEIQCFEKLYKKYFFRRLELNHLYLIPLYFARITACQESFSTAL